MEDNYEDVCSNYLNSLSWHIWTLRNANKNVSNEIGVNEKNVLKEIHGYLVENKEEITYREIYLNFCILLAVSISDDNLLGLENELEVRQYMLKCFYDKLNEDKEDEMDEEGIANNMEKKVGLDDKGKD